MTYTQQQVDEYAMPCPGCGTVVEQSWVDVTEPVFEAGAVRWAEPREFVPGRWTCRTEFCEYGPPVRPPDCICPLVDVSTLGDQYTRWWIGGDPGCPA